MSDIQTNVDREVLAPHRPSTRVTQARRTGKKQECEPGCCCVQCSMTTLLRPRYYAGQLLSDVDLRDEQAYQIAKDRLHNRYLHGYGVVCGLQVTCDDCDPRSVTIRPGYALGPCGEDILVPCTETLDVIAAINACKRRPTDCDPLVRRPDDIDRADEHWCITLAYDEQQVTPRAALRPPRASGCGCSEGRGCAGSGGCGCGGSGAKAGSGGCGCGGSGAKAGSGGCGCGGKSSNGNGNGAHKGSCSCGQGCECGPVPTRVYEPGKGLACEPTRVRETYRLGVVDRACATCDTSLRNSELFRAFGEVSGALALTTKRMGTANMLGLAMYAFVPYDSLPDTYQNPTAVTTTLIAGKRGVWDLYSDNPLGIPCPDLATVKAVEILDPPSQTPGTSPNVGVSKDWQVTQQAAAFNLLTLGLRYLWEWFCYKLQPPCPPDPCDDRLIIACVTVRNGAVIDVCNFSCRKRAGSFTARDYWLSLFGIKPLVLMLLERLCCGDFIRARSPIRNRLAEVLDLVDPAGDLRAAIARDDFLRVRKVAGDLASVREQVDLGKVVAAVRSVVAPEEGADLVGKLDRPVYEVQQDLERAGVAHTVREVDEPPLLAAVRAAALTGAEDVVLLRDKVTGRLAGVERAAPAGGEVRAERERVDTLTDEVESLRAELAALRREVPQAREAPPGKAIPKKATAKKATARAAAPSKATAKKTTARAAAPSKATAKKTTARTAAPSKAAAKKATVKKATVKKTTAKKTSAKKTATRKGTAKRSTTRGDRS